MAQLRLSAFTDAVHPDFDQALDLLAAQGFGAVELRQDIYGKSLADLDFAEAQQVARALQRQHLQVSCLWTPLFAELNGQPVPPNLTDSLYMRLNHYLDLAELLDVRSLRIAAPVPAKGEERGEQEEAFQSLIRQAADLAAERWTRLLLENEPESLTSNCLELGRFLYRVDHPSLNAAWNFVKCWQAGEYPDATTYAYIAGTVRHVYVRGARADKSDPTTFATFALPGADDLQHPALLGLLLREDYEGYATIDPHYSGFAPEDQIKGVERGAAEAVFRTADYLRQTTGAA